MTDIAHNFGNDLAIGPTGDLAVATGNFEVQQRILRALMTNPGDYIWQLGFGAGLPAMVGQVTKPLRIAAIIKAQLLLDPGVAHTPPPQVTVQANTDGTTLARITYSDAATGATQTLTAPVT